MKYKKEIEKIHKDIKDLNVQGATNVAIATLEGMKIVLSRRFDTYKEMATNLLEVGRYLAYARPNEPLAQNAVLYIQHMLDQEHIYNLSIEEGERKLKNLCDEFLNKIEQDKKRIVDINSPKLKHIDHILTHCHSSTAVSLIKGISNGDHDFTAVCTETRPRYQGRITAKELIEANIDTTLITDSAAESFVIGRGSESVSEVFIGCDVVTMKGFCINKIGSWGIAMSAYQSGKPLYVVTPLLKIDPDTEYHDIEIEIREDRELWDKPPKGLKMYNPSFEVVDAGLITGFITEFGTLKPKDISNTVKKEYPWLFVKQNYY